MLWALAGLLNITSSRTTNVQGTEALLTQVIIWGWGMGGLRSDIY